MERQRHTLYLSDTAWAELRRRAIIEGEEASQIVERVLRAWLESRAESTPSGRRSRAETLENLGKRTIYLQPEVWGAISALANEQKFSVSVLVERLLRNYLGVPHSADILPR